MFSWDNLQAQDFVMVGKFEEKERFYADNGQNTHRTSNSSL